MLNASFAFAHLIDDTGIGAKKRPVLNTRGKVNFPLFAHFRSDSSLCVPVGYETPPCAYKLRFRSFPSTPIPPFTPACAVWYALTKRINLGKISTVLPEDRPLLGVE
ncbi:uncharacterized protein FOMMEDRAFT_159374 [Fomitiporia mediterranea MF3/22]|uniref:uncharacterized protein n=1 Tax=Fomitiporia mediterranea (strain MF3/22) TaxID=694068 RepID=UPI00044081BA|nr:uncharacterized protein FOMMEDRAFT_159374 [Fomitiporia mediterranea MF3/22]EJD00613.1 hypothetical protein FOMMEDRAFT_159374 [Fomitiporia mediterranea MF3/22]